jgi:hypothetical protein
MYLLEALSEFEAGPEMVQYSMVVALGPQSTAAVSRAEMGRALVVFELMAHSRLDSE